MKQIHINLNIYCVLNALNRVQIITRNFEMYLDNNMKEATEERNVLSKVTHKNVYKNVCINVYKMCIKTCIKMCAKTCKKRT